MQVCSVPAQPTACYVAQPLGVSTLSRPCPSRRPAIARPNVVACQAQSSGTSHLALTLLAGHGALHHPYSANPSSTACRSTCGPACPCASVAASPHARWCAQHTRRLPAARSMQQTAGGAARGHTQSKDTITSTAWQARLDEPAQTGIHRLLLHQAGSWQHAVHSGTQRACDGPSSNAVPIASGSGSASGSSTQRYRPGLVTSTVVPADSSGPSTKHQGHGHTHTDAHPLVQIQSQPHAHPAPHASHAAPAVSQVLHLVATAQRPKHLLSSLHAHAAVVDARVLCTMLARLHTLCEQRAAHDDAHGPSSRQMHGPGKSTLASDSSSNSSAESLHAVYAGSMEGDVSRPLHAITATSPSACTPSEYDAGDSSSSSSSSVDAWAPATCMQLMSTLLRRIRMAVTDMTPRQAAQVAWLLAKLPLGSWQAAARQQAGQEEEEEEGSHPEALFVLVERPSGAVASSGSSSTRPPHRTLSACRRVDVIMQALPQVLAVHLLQHLEHANAQDISQLLYGLARLDAPPSVPQAHALLHALASCLGAAEGQPKVAAHARMHAQRRGRQLNVDLCPQALSMSLWAMAHMQLPLPHAWVGKVLRRLTGTAARQGSSFARGSSARVNGQGLSNTLWALATIPARRPLAAAEGSSSSSSSGGAWQPANASEQHALCAWFTAAQAASLLLLQRMHSRELLPLMWACAQLRLQPATGWQQAAVCALGDRLSRLSAQDVSHAAWAISTWRYPLYRSPMLAAGFAARALALRRQLSPAGLVTVLSALAAPGGAGLQLHAVGVEALADAAAKRLAEFGPGPLCALLPALLRAGHRPRDRWLERYLRAVQANLASVSPSELLRVLLALARGGMAPPSRHWLQACLVALLAGRGRLSAGERALALWAVAVITSHMPCMQAATAAAGGGLVQAYMQHYQQHLQLTNSGGMQSSGCPRAAGRLRHQHRRLQARDSPQATAARARLEDAHAHQHLAPMPAAAPAAGVSPVWLIGMAGGVAERGGVDSLAPSKLAALLQGLTLLGAHSHMPMQPSPPLMHALWCRLAETCTAPTFHARRLAGSLRCMALLAGGSMASPPHALQAEAGLTAVHGTLLVMRVKGQDTPSAKHLTDLASLTAGVHGRMPSGHVPSGHATSANGRQVQQQLARHALRLQVAAVLQRRRNQRRAANNYTGTINCGVSHAHSQQQRPGRDPAAARERSALRQLQALYLLLRQGAAGLQAGTGPVGTAAAGDATAAPGRSGSSVQLGAGGGAGCGAQAGGGGGGGGRSLEAAAAVGELLVEKVYGLAALQLLR